jgi:hypothetical protein
VIAALNITGDSKNRNESVEELLKSIEERLHAIQTGIFLVFAAIAVATALILATP